MADADDDESETVSGDDGQRESARTHDNTEHGGYDVTQNRSEDPVVGKLNTVTHSNEKYNKMKIKQLKSLFVQQQVTTTHRMR